MARDLDADVFLHLWEDDIASISRAEKFYKPKALVVSRSKDWHAVASTVHKKRSGDRPIRSLSMFQAFHELDEALTIYEKDHGQYDYTVRLRPDLYLGFSAAPTFLPVNNISAVLPYHATEGINDQFAIGNREMYRSFGRVIANLEAHLNQVRFSPHVLLKHQFELDGITWCIAPLRYAILRSQHPSGTIDEIEDAVLAEGGPAARIVRYNRTQHSMVNL